MPDGCCAFSRLPASADVSSHNIAALFPFGSMGKHDICIKSGTKTMIVTVVDTNADRDCDGCCTITKANNDALVDLESATDVCDLRETSVSYGTVVIA